MTKFVKNAPISVVIPCYVAADSLERAVDSVFNQSLKPNEIILIDDASPDGGKTKRLIGVLVRKYTNLDAGISIVTKYLESNKGPGGARNAGWEVASQEWVAFLDADDAWHHDKIKLQYEITQSDTKIDLLAHQTALFDTCLLESIAIVIKKPIQLVRLRLGAMLLSNKLPTRSVMLRRSIPFRFPESKHLSEDYYLWLVIIAGGYHVKLMKCVLAFTFRPEYSVGGYSGQLWIQEKRELATLIKLYCNEKINAITLVVSLLWSLLKYTKRVIYKSLF